MEGGERGREGGEGGRVKREGDDTYPILHIVSISELVF